MKRAGIILAIIGLILLIGGNFLYRSKNNPVDSQGSARYSETVNGKWGTKIPVFAGGVLIAVGLIFYIADKNKRVNSDRTYRS
jgi:hypothetical protein